MAREKNEQGQVELAQAVNAIHEMAGSPRPAEVARWMAADLGPYRAPSGQWFPDLLAGKVNPRTADLVYLASLARFYDVPISEFHPDIADRVLLFQEGLNDRPSKPAAPTRRTADRTKAGRQHRGSTVKRSTSTCTSRAPGRRQYSYCRAGVKAAA